MIRSKSEDLGLAFVAGGGLISRRLLLKSAVVGTGAVAAGLTMPRRVAAQADIPKWVTVSGERARGYGVPAEAEASVHGQPDLEKLHFHEVGQSDALADIIGSSAAIHSLNCDSVYCTPINVGSGTIKCAHGIMPVPAPATLELLRKGKFYFRGGIEQKELLTPTGAAILTHFARPLESFPQGRVISIGYGAGDSELSGPNVLQGTLCGIDSCLIPEAALADALPLASEEKMSQIAAILMEYQRSNFGKKKAFTMSLDW